jgi:hypothetical protein
MHDDGPENTGSKEMPQERNDAPSAVGAAGVTAQPRGIPPPKPLTPAQREHLRARLRAKFH